MISGMKNAFPLILVGILFQVFITPGTAQVKSGGFLGFKKKGSQVSGGLFPDDVLVPRDPSFESSSSPSSELTDDEPSNGIFREGETPVVQRDEKKGGFVFPFGKKRNQSNTADSNLISEPVPPVLNSPSEAVTVAEEISPQVMENTSPAPVVADTAGDTTANEAPRANPSEEPVFDSNGDEEEDRGGVFSFFSWKDRKKTSSSNDADTDPLANANVETGEDGVVIIKADPDKLAGNNNKPGSVLIGNEPTADDSSGGLFSGLTKTKERRKKPVDYSNFETVMENGEFVEKDEPDFSAATAPATAPVDGEVRAPQVIDGVKTYSSWDQVGGRNVSAAEKILRNAR